MEFHSEYFELPVVGTVSVHVDTANEIACLVDYDGNEIAQCSVVEACKGLRWLSRKLIDDVTQSILEFKNGGGLDKLLASKETPEKVHGLHPEDGPVVLNLIRTYTSKDEGYNIDPTIAKKTVREARAAFHTHIDKEYGDLHPVAVQDSSQVGFHYTLRDGSQIHGEIHITD